MIYTEENQLEQYLGLSDNLDIAIRYLMAHPLSALTPGRNEVAGERVYINRFAYDTLAEQDAFFEAHRRYADIHLLLEGEEQIRTANPAALAEFERDDATDYIGYHGTGETACTMRPGKVLIAFPEDAHMVKLQLNGVAHVEKAVVKVLLAE